MNISVPLTDKVRLNPVVGEAAGWNGSCRATRVDIRAVGVAPLTREIRLGLTTRQLREVAVVGKVIAKDEHAGPLIL